jgi:hypothetical protein
MQYRYLNTRGWLNEAESTGSEPAARQDARSAETLSSTVSQARLPPSAAALARARGGVTGAMAETLADAGDWQNAEGTVFMSPEWGGSRPLESRMAARNANSSGHGLDTTPNLGGAGVFLYTVEQGQRVLMRRPNGTMDVINGPKQVWKGQNRFTALQHYVAHPGDYLIVRHRDGLQEHLAGPCEVWFDPRTHQEIQIQEGLQLAAKEAVVVYSTKVGTGSVQRRIVEGPALFVPQPGEWLHTFSWHASKGGSKGVVKVPNGLVFQKLWMMPDQMYHDVSDVRTADDAVLTIRLMIFFELKDITTLLEASHDPIGDFVNAASSDVVEFVARHDLESFKRHTDKLNELETYKQLTGRALQCGYRIDKVVYRGYGAPERLQTMHDQAIEARTKLQLERETERQRQDLESAKLESDLLRAAKRRTEQSQEIEHEVELKRRKLGAELEGLEASETLRREQARLDAELKRKLAGLDDTREREHLGALKQMGVDLTAYLTRGQPDRIIELRGSDASTHLHLQSET